MAVLGCALAAPAPLVKNQLALTRSDNDFKLSGNVLRRMESSLDEIEPIFKRRKSDGT